MIVSLLNKTLDFNLRLHNLGLYIATSQCNDPLHFGSTWSIVMLVLSCNLGHGLVIKTLNDCHYVETLPCLKCHSLSLRNVAKNYSN